MKDKNTHKIILEVEINLKDTIKEYFLGEYIGNPEIGIRELYEGFGERIFKTRPKIVKVEKIKEEEK